MLRSGALIAGLIVGVPAWAQVPTGAQEVAGGAGLWRAGIADRLLVAQAEEDPEDPGGKSSDEPGGRKATAPGAGPAAKASDEPRAAAAPVKAAEPAPPATVAAKADKPTYGAGLHVRGLFVPEWFLNAFLDASTPLYSAAIGGEFVRRKGNFDIVATINFGFYSPEDGNYLGNGKNPAIDTDYIQFRDLNLLAFDVAFIGHHYFLPWLSLIYGAGLGFGVVLGDIYRISNYQGRCTPENVSDTSTCAPVVSDADLARWNQDHDKYLADTAPKCSDQDSPGSPCQFREDDVWPVVPIVHLLLGVNFKINEQFSVRVDGGFHNAFYFGGAGHYFFW